MSKLRMVFFIFLMMMLFLFLIIYSKPTPAETEWRDLVLLQNLPESEARFHSSHQLVPIHVYKNGHFLKVGANLTWNSSNRQVAQVNQDGVVNLNGKNGKATITVTDGSFQDQIGVSVDGRKTVLKKESGQRYDILPTAIKYITMEEKVGQMLMPDFRTWEHAEVTNMLPEIERLVKEFHLGGVILFKENMQSVEQAVNLTAAYQTAAEKYALFLSIDQEGGVINRLPFATAMPGNMALGAARDDQLTEGVGRTIGEELALLGINMDFAPILDVNNNPDNPVIGLRSFGSESALVAEMGEAFTRGLQASGVAATAKHFPGHGDTVTDSHLGLPAVNHDQTRLNKIELPPFQSLMKKEIDAIMTAHITYPKIDSTKIKSAKSGEEIYVPATLSFRILTELMREDMGYTGVITTDALNMNAIAEHFSPLDSAVRAVKAGADILLMPVGIEEVANGLYAAVKNGEIPMERIDESVERILALKVKRGILKEEHPASIKTKIEKAKHGIRSTAHQNIEAKAAERGVTLVKNEGVLPLLHMEDKEIVVVGKTFLPMLKDQMEKYDSKITVIEAEKPYDLSIEDREALKRAVAVVIASHTSYKQDRSSSNPQMQLINEAIKNTKAPTVVIAIQNPYDIMAFPDVEAFIAQFGYTEANFKATAAVLFGQLNPSGKLPVAIPGTDGEILYDFGYGLSY
ncbi:glycoside hydrolase family 3 N-terminal domain-containing protein [Cytobacillus purgationiresistens]|uniref:beta-N-acetylhexosaminidase n=1 Tax=Cytobacillus purgationiresistens TaxID=863449 RepID=A0ABU0ANB4_9BACI|nr:glycoside hydrolase family 3 N-terminal domain-containing protein [Cytobacillus purgationiresistens]MDQ0272344.1 beta-N-acetylhexosaminidase [Cytobacillus purgationiresistens]